MPSQPSHHEPQIKVDEEVRVVTDNSSKPSSAGKSMIAIGDRVEVSDCPGHWAWASPFTVEAIDGEMVKLEMVMGRVEIERLSSA